MSEHRPPRIELSFKDLPVDPTERHEALVDVFGRYIMWLREWSISATKELVRSEEARERLGTIRRKKYDELASLPREQQELAFKVIEAGVDRFIQLLLTMLSGRGIDDRLGDDHAIWFRLDMEIVDIAAFEVVSQETLNRDGKKFFADYWGRWINEFKSGS